MQEELTLSKAGAEKNSPTWLQKYGYLLIFAAVSILVALFAFGGSPFYPLNEWEDPNVFLTVGRAVLDGKVIYRDIYEQKGPYIYFLHAVAALISDTSFLGVWILEIINLFFVMLLVFKIVALYGHNRLTCSICAILVGVSASFSYAMSTGDSVEEFSACFYLWLLYTTVKTIKSGQKFTSIQYLLIGIMAGIVFWTKFTMVAIYLGWFLYFAWRSIRRKEGKEIVKLLAYIVAGVIISTLPCLIYFLAYGAVKDWVAVYLYNNLFLYSDNAGLLFTIWELIKSIMLTIVCNPHYTIPMLLGVVWFALKKDGEERWFLTWIVPVTAFTLYVGGRGYRYYGLLLYVFAVFGYIAVLDLLQGKSRRWFQSVASGAAAVLLATSFVFFFVNGRNYYIFRDKEDTAQYQVARYIREHGDEDATLLTWGMLDSGFYLASEQIPAFRYFSRFNIPVEEMYTEVQRYMDEGLADYVVYCIGEQNLVPFTHEDYKEVGCWQERSRGDKVTYYLYEHI